MMNGRIGAEADYFSKLRRLLAKMEPDDQKLLLDMAQKSRETSPNRSISTGVFKSIPALEKNLNQ